MAIAESWHVRSRGRECAASQRSFVDGETIVTALFPDPESSGYIRRDYSVEGWKSYQASGDAPFSFWRTKYSAPGGGETASQVEKLSAEEILQRLVEEDEDHTENARFILAVMLERQKLLRETDSQRTPTGILRVYEHRKTGEVFIVKDPNIPLSEIESVQNEVFVLLENNGRSPVVEISENGPPERSIAEEPSVTDAADLVLTDAEAVDSEPDAAIGEADADVADDATDLNAAEDTEQSRSL